MFAVYPNGISDYLYKKTMCANDNQFIKDTAAVERYTQNIINNSGTIKYFKDTFDNYSDNSKLIEQFDNINGFQVKGDTSDVKTDPESYSGSSSLSLTVNGTSDSNDDSIVIRKNLSQPINLEKWTSSGIYSVWMKIKNRNGLLGVNLKIGDKNNSFRNFEEINNLQVNVPNNYDSDDTYPNIDFPEKRTLDESWTDYWLNNGWNYLFWRADDGFYKDNGAFDIKNITWFEITLRKDNTFQTQVILLDNLRIQDGFQKDKNSLGGAWFAPNARPQYGLFDIDKTQNGKHSVKLLNVRQSQYPSNGDHGRMILNYGTPMNFSLRTRFKLTNFPKSNQERANTWFRVNYDFDPFYDPGHDSFGAFVSLEWDKLGLVSVIPIERNSIQDQEPEIKNISDSSTKFVPQENTLYEMQLTVRGQESWVSIYEVGNDCLILRGRASYTFKRPRYGEDKRYPVCLEVTGNIKAIIYSVEIKEL